MRTLCLSALALLAAGAAPAQTIAVTGGTVFPVSGPRIDRGTVLIENGRITAVGAGIAIPDGATRIDAAGKWVTPGLIHAGSDAGLGIGSLFGESEAGVRGEVRPSFSPAEGYDPAAITIPVTRTGGVTTGIMGPRGPFMPGQAIAVDFAGTRLEDALVASGVALIVNLGSNSKDAGGGSRAGVTERIRQLFRDARMWAIHKADYDRGALRELAAPAAELEALLPALEGRLTVAFVANRAMDIGNALRLARELNVRAVLVGAAEGWQVAEAIAAARVPVVLEPNTDIPTFDGLGARLDNATLLRAAGVEVIIAQGDPGGERNLRFGAGNAVRNGMSWDDALRAVTLAPAQAFGLGDRYGSLEAGKVANLVIWSGDPFEFSSAAERVLIRGQDTSLRTRETELLERYRTLPPRP